jgi:hypothetical protein
MQRHPLAQLGMVWTPALRNHRQHPRDWLSPPAGQQLTLRSNQLSQLTEAGSHLSDVELLHDWAFMCCIFSDWSTCIACRYSRTSCCASPSRNSATVLARPSSSGMRALQPNSAMRLTSSCFFGVPSGLLLSQWIAP